MHRLALITIIALASCGWIRPDDDGGPATGDERGPCYPNQTCNEGLVCASERCVAVDGVGVGTDGSPAGEEEPQSPPRPPSTTGAPPAATCADMLQTCATQYEDGCIYDYVTCRGGDDPCATFYYGCALIGWSEGECSEGSESQTIFCGATGSTSMGDPDPYGSSGGGEWPEPSMDLGV